MNRKTEKPPIPELPNSKEELVDLLRSPFQILRQGEVVFTDGGVYRPGRIGASNVDLKCPFCGMEFTAVQSSSCFGRNASPSTCPNCNFPSHWTRC